MNKNFFQIALITLLLSPLTSNAQIDGRTVLSLTDSEISQAVCDETEYLDMYQNSTAILLDDFKNNSSNPLYIWSYRVQTT